MKWYTNWYTNTWNKTHKLIYYKSNFLNGQIFKFAEFSCWWTEFWCKSGVGDRKRDRVFTEKQIFWLMPQKLAKRTGLCLDVGKIPSETLKWTKIPSATLKNHRHTPFTVCSHTVTFAIGLGLQANQSSKAQSCGRTHSKPWEFLLLLLGEGFTRHKYTV